MFSIDKNNTFMKSKILSMISKEFNVGDTVSLFIDNQLITKGIVYIFGAIPMNKFYNKIYNHSGGEYEADTYEDALVLIDHKNNSNLMVLTLQDNDHKLFRWNDVFEEDNMKYEKIESLNNLKIIKDSTILTEIKYDLK